MGDILKVVNERVKGSATSRPYLETGSIEWKGARDKCVKNNTKTPNVHFRAFIFFALRAYQHNIFVVASLDNMRVVHDDWST